MLLLVVYVLLLLTLWWAWQRAARSHLGPGTTAPVAPPRPPPGPPPSPRPPRRRAVRHHAFPGPPLTEDDVIAFGLALERSDDVVRSAIVDESGASAGAQGQRDGPDPS